MNPRTQIRWTTTVPVVTLLAGVIALSGCGSKGGAKPAGGDKSAAAGGAPGAPTATPVSVTTAAEQQVVNAVAVNGNVTALQSVNLSPKVTERVLTVAGREGDPVRAGQVVVQQDTTDLQQQLQQDEANLQSAQAKLTQAKTNYRLQVESSSTAVQTAKAQLAAAKANLVLAQQPQRTEEVEQARIAVEQAQANYDKASTDRKRYEILVKEGAEAQATLDTYATTEKVQLATLNNAKESLKIAETGGRRESIQASEEQVRQAQIALQQAVSNVAQNEAKLDDVRAAQAAVAQAKAAADTAKLQIAEASIKSPIDGVIATRSTEPGQEAAPGTTVMTVVALDTVYFQAQVPETQVASVAPGKQVSVSVDALPGKTFTGKVATLFPTASTSSRDFNVRVDVPNASHDLRPGMFARGQVVVQKRRGVVIPKDALVSANSEGTAFQVFVANGTKAEKRPVKLGVQTPTTVEVLSGVHAGDKVITSGQDGLSDGALITVVKGLTDQAEGQPTQTASATP